MPAKLARPSAETLAAGTRQGLTPAELARIVEILGREPGELELGLFALNWSEHCSYKSSKHFLRKLPSESPRVLQGPGENAGVIQLDDELAVAFKVESHNHPSAVEPFNGAATGIGGIIRDILGMGARPIALLDSLRFGEPNVGAHRNTPVLDLLRGVVAGIAHYGNCVGVPTVGGELYFDDAYADDPLVNVLCVGLLHQRGERGLQPYGAVASGVGNVILLVGASTGRDGIHGATFASEELVGEKEAKRPNVQVGDPFKAKLLIEATLEACNVGARRAVPLRGQAQDLPLLIGLQDLGAGGLSTALPEMAARGGVGIELQLEKIPLRTRPMTPYEILLSESQERMVLCVPTGSELRFSRIFHKWGLEAAVIGRVIAEKSFIIRQEQHLLAQVPIEGLAGGPPPPDCALAAPDVVGAGLVPALASPAPASPQPAWEKPADWQARLLALLAAPGIGSRRPIYQQYDHTVQINTVVGPGAGDAAVLRIKDTPYGLVLTIDGNGRYGALDPYQGGAIAVCEAARNLVAVGAEPLGITDGLNFADPNDPEVYWAFAQAIQGLADAAQALEIPFVSGNVSFYNQSVRRKIPPTPIVGMVGLLRDINKRVPMGFQAPGDLIYRIGRARGGIGGSEFLKLFYGRGEAFVPNASPLLDKVELAFESRLLQAMRALAQQGLIRSAHDISEGGLLVTLAESALAGGRGAELDLDGRSEAELFGEWQSRFIVSVAPEAADSVARLLGERELPWACLGRVVPEPLLSLIGAHDHHHTSLHLDELRQAHEQALEGFFA